ncbi:FliH/SctL family protein [Chryseomicrobium palamuruense]|uniref:FliH/SctL family protein n=1 Tax=Chryseomicrobium palamuruense TaxID=682973 RepID=A0ABV8UVD6_9BACL
MIKASAVTAIPKAIPTRIVRTTVHQSADEQEEPLLVDKITQLRQQHDELANQLQLLRVQLEEERHDYLQENARLASEQADELKVQAVELGYQEGKQKAEAEAEAWLEEQTNVIHAIVLSATEDRRRYLLQAEQELIEIATAIARKIMTDAIQVQPDAVMHLVKQHIKLVEDAQEVTLQVSVPDYEYVHVRKEELESLLPPFTPLVIMPVKELVPGDVLIHTQASRYDARLDSQLAAIKGHLMSLVEEHTDEQAES